jgi:WD40 repeat protein
MPAALRTTMNYYKIGGSLKANHPTYVTRQADRQILELLTAREYCFVFNSRQMGKSSLRIQAIKKLKALGHKCATLDLTLIGGNLSQAQWYKGVGRQLLSNLELDAELDFNRWWQHQESWTYEQKLQQLIEQIILPKTTQNIVIFIDEVDRLIGLDFKDDFFAFIRACYNQRAENFPYDRLTFCLLGVTTPADLIQDKQRTPFNIGFSIELTGLTFAEANSALTPGLEEKLDDPEAVLKEVLNWTGGQPFLTQKLCQIVAQKSSSRQPNIGELVQQYIIKDWENQDEPEHLRTIRDRLLNNETKAIGMLGLYQQVLHSEVPADGGVGTSTYRQAELRLSGLVVPKNGYLKVYNPIYQAIFHADWVKQHLDKLRPYSEAMNNWLNSRTESTWSLTETAFNEAQSWAIGRSLSDVDYQFFDAIQKRQLELEIAEKEAQIQANQILTKANQKAHRIIRRGGAIALGLLLLIVGISTIYAQQQLQIAREAKEGTRLLQVVDNANRLSASRQIEALILAMQAGQDLNKLTKDRELISSPQSVTTLSALLNILVEIREVNQLQGDSPKGAAGSDREQLNRLVFSPDGKTILAGSVNGSIKLWQRDGTALSSFLADKTEINALSFSPNGEIIASGDDDGKIRLWHRNGTLVKTFPARDSLPGRRSQRQINDLTFSPNGQIIASAGSDRIVKLWQPDGTLIRSFTQSEFEVKSLSFSPNNAIIAVGLEDGTIQLHQLDGTLIKSLNEHQGWVTEIAFSPNGQIMASSSDDGTVKLWQADGTAIASLKHPMRVNGISFSPKGDIIASVSEDRAARLWQLDGTLITTLPVDIGQPTAIAFSSDGKLLAATTTEGIVKLWDANLERNALPIFHGNSSQGFNRVDFSKDGNIVLVGDRGTINIWQPDGTVISGSNPPKNGKILASVGLSKDGTIAAFGSDGGTVELWQQGNVKAVSGNGNRLTSITFSLDGEIAVGNDEGTIKLWKPDGTQIASFPTHQRGWITSLSFSPDGKLLASGSDDDDPTIKLWKLDGTEVASFLGHTKQVNSISFSPNRQIIASGSGDRAVKLWKLDGSPIATLTGHIDAVNSVSFSPNGQIIASGSEDGTIKLWQADGTPIATLKGSNASISSLNFSDDGKVLATASRDGTVILWDLDLDRVLVRGCRWLQDYFRTHPETLQTLTACAQK